MCFVVAKLLEYRNESMSKSEIVYFWDGSVELPKETSLKTKGENYKYPFYVVVEE